MKTSIIQLEPNDDIISIQDKMTWSKSPCILMVWPERGKLLRRKIDLILVIRQGQKLGAQVGLVTRDRAVTTYAGEVGLPVFRNLRSAQKYHWQSSPLQESRFLRKPVDRLELRQEGERLHKIKAVLPEKTGLRLAFFTLAVLSVLVLAMFFYPSARLVITPAQKTQTADLEIWASPSVQVAGITGGIPARPVTVVVEGQREVESTGTIQVADQFATGRIEFTNLTASEVNLPEGTVLRTADDPTIRFQTTNTVTVPAGPGKTMDVEAQAVLPGATGNIAAEKVVSVEGDASLQVSVTNPEAFAGGTEQASPAPSEADYQSAREALLKSLEKPAIQVLQRTMTPGQELIPASIQLKTVLKETSLPAVGQPGDRLRLTMQVEFSAWQIASRDLENAAFASLDAGIPAGYLPIPGTISIQQTSEPVMSEDHTARWQVRAQRSLRAYRPTDEIIGLVQGRPVVQALQILNQKIPMQSSPQVTLSPSWWFWMPSLPFRIELATQ